MTDFLPEAESELRRILKEKCDEIERLNKRITKLERRGVKDKPDNTVRFEKREVNG